MRELSQSFQARLEAGATTLCRAWRLTRRDGLVLGFTDHDRALVFEGTEFRASSGLAAGEVDRSTGLAVDNTVALGALSDAALCEEDIAAGRYDDATVTQWTVDWAAPEHRLVTFEGRIGEIRRGIAGFEAELRSVSDRLNQPVGRVIQALCDASFGDGCCGIDATGAAYAVTVSVLAVSPDGGLTVSGAAGYAPEWFAFGTLRWRTGLNAGQVQTLRLDRFDAADRVVTPWSRPLAEVTPGDTADLVAGCDKRMSTCRDRFANLLNFRGFPHVPGDDWMTGYPRDGGVHDGGSLFDGTR